MKVVVDTNIIFSAMLNTNSKISFILLKPKSGLNFYATKVLLDEIHKHSDKLKGIAGYTDAEFEKILAVFMAKIKLIDPMLISKAAFETAIQLTEDIDIDDAEFVALAEHIQGVLWTGDKELVTGLEKKKWKKYIQTEKLYSRLKKNKVDFLESFDADLCVAHPWLSKRIGSSSGTRKGKLLTE